VFFEAIDQLLGTRSNNRRFEAFTPKAALNFKLLPNISIYTSYGFSFDSPAGNELDNFPTSSNTSVLINPDLKAQKSQNFELGIKGNLKNPEEQFLSNILFETTFFNSVIEDEIIPFEVFGDVFYRNAAQTTRRGLEVGADVDLLPWFNFQASYTFSDFSYDSYEAITINENLDTTTQNFSGNEVPSVPMHNVYLSLSLSQMLARGITGFIRGSFRQVSGMYVDDANSDKTGDYSLLNAGMGLDMVFGNFNLLVTGGINNILDKVFVGFININSANGRFYEAGEPRNFYAGINLGYAFR
jgi:iron complex outermembrane receptor protein